MHKVTSPPASARPPLDLAGGAKRIIAGNATEEDYENAVLVSSVKDVVTTAAQVAPVLSAVSAVGSIGLMASSARDLIKARKTEKRLSALSNLTWGAQGAGMVAGHLLETGPWLAHATAACGVAGGAIASGLGLHQIYQGLEMKDDRETNLGVINTLAGAAWTAGSMGMAPVLTGGAFILLTVGGKVYKAHSQAA
jgi:hypothetical protein